MPYRISTALLLVALLLVPALAGCGGSSTEGSAPKANIDSAGGAEGEAGTSQTGSSHGNYEVPDGDDQEFPSVSDGTRTRPKPKPNLYPEVVIETDLGEIRVRLNAEKAPITVDNFLQNYVNRGSYENTIFHHVEKDFIVVAGGYAPDLTPVEARAEILNEAYNGLKNVRGTIAMARHPDAAKSATCQFFINLADNTALDHVDRQTDANYGYCVFGEVIQGMDIVDQIADSPVRAEGDFPKLPVNPVVIHAIRQTR
jgi:cyclophilin family peptidyl-prolyl cis-trans isomerase